ncbi:Zn-ribbon domain-containing protein [Candidatus Woesearchaeota archaeon]|nr:Zn-ribbon domain-containing protein [Candidatus Woesearchaeota archaeon]
MPHQCVRCSKFYDDGANEILKGCSCGGKLFFYIRKDKLKKAKEVTEQVNLTKEDKKQIEKDVFDMVGSEIDKDQPVVLDLEAIRVSKPGKYELDLVNLFKKEPLVIKLEEGKYMIDVVESFNQMSKKEKD